MFYGAHREYYQVNPYPEGYAGVALHSLKHFALHFFHCEKVRVRDLNEAPRHHNVNFKLLSHREK